MRNCFGNSVWRQRDIESDYINAKKSVYRYGSRFFAHRLEIAQNDIGTDAMIELIDTSRHFYKVIQHSIPPSLSVSCVGSKAKMVVDLPNDRLSQTPCVSRRLSLSKTMGGSRIWLALSSTSDYQVGTDLGVSSCSTSSTSTTANCLIETRMSGAPGFRQSRLWLCGRLVRLLLLAWSLPTSWTRVVC